MRESPPNQPVASLDDEFVSGGSSGVREPPPDKPVASLDAEFVSGGSSGVRESPPDKPVASKWFFDRPLRIYSFLIRVIRVNLCLVSEFP